jgi:hypothetical protein
VPSSGGLDPGRTANQTCDYVCFPVGPIRFRTKQKGIAYRASHPTEVGAQDGGGRLAGVLSDGQVWRGQVAINYVAPVKGHELATRAELLRTQPDHPRAKEMYYKIQIGPLERQPRSIPSHKWRRITFVYTTGEKFMAAEELNDLIVQSGERERLWKALRERGLAAERQYEISRTREIDLALLCELGKLGITLGDGHSAPPEKKVHEPKGWQYLAFPEATVKEQLPEVVQTIEQAVQKLGGLAP